MPKVSRPIVYTLVGAVVFYIVFDLTQPEPPPAHARTHYMVSMPASSEPATDDADGQQPSLQDVSAHFARFSGEIPDPFLPKVLPASGRAKPAGDRAEKWALTGIYSIGGALHALVENSTTGETASLQPGDRWRGLRVSSIGSNAVEFENALGQSTELAFPQPVVAPPAGSGPLPPMPISGPLRPLPPLQQAPMPTAIPGRMNHP